MTDVLEIIATEAVVRDIAKHAGRYVVQEIRSPLANLEVHVRLTEAQAEIIREQVEATTLKSICPVNNW